MYKDLICYKVKLRSMEDLTAKAYLATDYNGNQCWIPKSQVAGPDWLEENSWWISTWILEKKNLTYSSKRPYRVSPHEAEPINKTVVRRHTPPELTPQEIEPDASLVR